MSTWIIAALVLIVIVQHQRVRRLTERLDDTRRENHVFQYETFERLHKVEAELKRLGGSPDAPPQTSCGTGPRVFDA